MCVGPVAGIVGALKTIGTVVGIAGTAVQAVSAFQANKANAAYADQQAKDEAILTAVQDDRTRQKFRAQIAQQRSELSARGVSLDSPTAVFLGQTAAREMSFASQSVRSGGAARVQELGAEARAYRSRASQALVSGGVSAAGQFLTAAPDIWPGLKGEQGGAQPWY